MRIDRLKTTALPSSYFQIADCNSCRVVREVLCEKVSKSPPPFQLLRSTRRGCIPPGLSFSSFFLNLGAFSFSSFFLNLGAFYHPQTKVMFSRASVCPRGGVCLPLVGGGLPHPRADTPPGGYYGIRSTSGRYASHWNAFSLQIHFRKIFSMKMKITPTLKKNPIHV